jgi:hypothetical protein
MTEKTISIWFNHEVWTGRWTRRGFGQAALIRSIERFPLCDDPLSSWRPWRDADEHSVNQAFSPEEATPNHRKVLTVRNFITKTINIATNTNPARRRQLR